MPLLLKISVSGGGGSGSDTVATVSSQSLVDNKVSIPMNI
jgi:hypothetical protein